MKCACSDSTTPLDTRQHASYTMNVVNKTRKSSKPMKITRLKSDKDNLTISTWKYWFCGLYSGGHARHLFIVPTKDLGEYIGKVPEGQFDEFRLLKGFPMLASAQKHKKKCEAWKKKGGKRRDLYGQTREISIDIVRKPKEKLCKDCSISSLKKPFTIRCRNCCLKYIEGPLKGSCVYGLYNGTNELVYIGVTDNPPVRVHDHLKSKSFKKMKIIKSFAHRDEADDFERRAISTLKPPVNILIIPTPDLPLKEQELFGKVSGKRRKAPAISETPS